MATSLILLRPYICRLQWGVRGEPEAQMLKSYVEWLDAPPSLPVLGSTVSIPRGNLSPSPLARLELQAWTISWQPFIKNRFQKAPLPRDSALYKSKGRNAPVFTRSPRSTPSIRYTPNFQFICAARGLNPWQDKGVDKRSENTISSESTVIH